MSNLANLVYWFFKLWLKVYFITKVSCRKAKAEFSL
jgi:hypothetical protein